MNELPQILSVKQVAAMLNYSERAFRNKIQTNAKHPFPVKPIRQGRMIGFDLRDIEAYVASLKEPTECATTHPEK